MLSAFYPEVRGTHREAEADVADRDAIINAFHAAGYVMAGEVPGELMTFRAGSFLRRLWLTFDDRVTVRTFGGGIVIEGIRKERYTPSSG